MEMNAGAAMVLVYRFTQTAQSHVHSSDTELVKMVIPFVGGNVATRPADIKSTARQTQWHAQHRMQKNWCSAFLCCNRKQVQGHK